MTYQEFKEYFTENPTSTITIGGLKSIIKDYHNDIIPFYIYDAGCWRGYYKEAYITVDKDEDTKENILSKLNELTSGKVYEGYKGGAYTYDDNTPIHFDRDGWSNPTFNYSLLLRYVESIKEEYPDFCNYFIDSIEK